jgi:hypothetical protein
LGASKRFPQHCQLPCLTPKQHFQAPAEEITKAINMDDMSPVKRGIIKTLQNRIEQALQQPKRQDLQRVSTQEQRVTADKQHITIPRLTNAPTIMQARKPTAKQALKSTPRIHRCTTRNNTPGQLPLITKRQNDMNNEAQGIC